MPVDSRHEDYELHELDWKKCRDTIEGENAVLAGGEVYLPIPPGMQKTQTVVSGQSTTTRLTNGPAHYQHYLSFARFPEIVAPQVNGVQGLIHSTELSVELPTELEYLLETATPNGMGLLELWEHITREVFSTGRVNLLAEIMAEDDSIRLCPYSVESFINWRLATKEDGSLLKLAVLEEHSKVPKDDDPFVDEDVIKWRELAIDEESGVYQVRRWVQMNEKDGPTIELDPDTGEEWVVPVLFGEGFAEVPLWPVNAVDTGWHYGPIPIIPTVRRALSIYRLTADYYRALHIKGDPQAVLFGVDKDSGEVPSSIGGSQIWSFTNPDGHAEYLDIDGGGIPATLEAISAEYDRVSAESGRMIDSQKETTAESGEAVRRRQAFQLVTVSSMVVNAAASLEEIIKKVGSLMQLDQAKLDEVKIAPDLSFTESDMTYDDLIKAMQARNQGAPLLIEDIHDDMRARRLVSRPYEEFLEMVGQEAPTSLMQAGPAGLLEGPDDQQADGIVQRVLKRLGVKSDKPEDDDETD